MEPASCNGAGGGGERGGGSESEPMLGLGDRVSSDSDMDARPSMGPPEKPARRPESRRCSLFTVMSVLCGLSLIVLPSFIFLHLFQAQEHPASSDNGDKGESSQPGQQKGSDHATNASLEQPSTSSASSLASSLPSQTPFSVSLADQLDLNTGFDVSDTPATREFVFNITRDLGAPDGIEKPMILVNGQSPGPLIEANTGDTIRVLVNNMMPNASTTLHWHGIDQRGTTWMDGVYGLSQCGVPPGESFTYEFRVPGQRGTFWYHSHLAVQFTDGLYGPMIIHDPDEKVPAVDDDKILMIGDLYHGFGEMVLADYLSSSPSYAKMPGMEPPPDNVIVNGRHVYNCSAPDVKHGESDGETKHDGHGDGRGKSRRHPSARCSAGSLWSTRVKSSDRFRLRLISNSANMPYYFTIDNHTLEIVEMDGVEIEPIRTTRLFMNPGQRYSVLVAADQGPGNYLMRAIVAARCFHLAGHHGMKVHPHGDEGLPNVDFQGVAVLSYDDTDVDAEPLGEPWDVESEELPGGGEKEPWKGPCHDMPFRVPKPVREIPAYEVGDGNHHYFSYRMHTEDDVFRTVINKTIFAPLKDDATLWRTLRKNVTFQDDSDEGSSLWDFGDDQLVLISRDPEMGAQIVINSRHMMSHPWHLHGQNFQVVGWGNGLYGKSKTKWNFDNPMRRDTITVPGDAHVVIRIVGDNPGLWALHCHVLFHAEGGMSISLAQRMDELRVMLDSLDGASSNGVEGIKQRFCLAGPSRPVLPDEES